MNTELLLWSSAVLALAVVPAYGVLWEIHRSPWNKGPYRRIGRVLFSKSAIIALVLTFSLIAGLLVLVGVGRPLWFEIVRLVTFSLIVPVLWWQWYTYRQTRKGGHSEENLSRH